MIYAEGQGVNPVPPNGLLRPLPLRFVVRLADGDRSHAGAVLLVVDLAGFVAVREGDMRLGIRRTGVRSPDVQLVLSLAHFFKPFGRRFSQSQALKSR